MFFLPISALITMYIDLSGPCLAESASTTNANLPGIRSLRVLDALITLEQVGGTGGGGGAQHRGRETLVQLEGWLGPGHTGRRESERDNNKNPFPFLWKVLGTSTVVQGKGLEGWGQTEGTGNSKSVD